MTSRKGERLAMAAERPGKKACMETFLFTSESVGEGHPGRYLSVCTVHSLHVQVINIPQLCGAVEI